MMNIEEVIKFYRLQGATFQKIADELGITKVKAFRIFHGKRNKGKQRTSRVIDYKQVVRMRKQGKSIKQIAEKFEVSLSTICLICKGVGKRATNESLIVRLSEKGLTRKEIVAKTGLNYRTVSRYTDIDIKHPKIKMTKKKEVKAVQPMVERYELIGKGISKGVKEVKTTLREGRNDGVTVSFRYKDEYSNKPATIYVKDDVSPEFAANRWCERNGKTLIGVL